MGLVCRQGVGSLFLQSGLVHEVIEVDKADSKKRKEAFKKTKTFNPDLIVSPHRSLRTALWVRRLRAKNAVGFRDPWTFFAYDKRMARPKNAHDVQRQLSLLTGLDISPELLPESLLSLDIDVPTNEKFSVFTNFVALSPGSQWETKRWTEEGFIKVGQKLKAAGFMIVVFGSGAERDLCQRVADGIPGAINLSGQTTILELAQALRQARLLICNDSGTMHVATAVGTAVVSIFGATTPSQGYSPWSKTAKVIEIDLPCRPCGAHGHRQCPLVHHDCMKKISADQVLKVAEGFLP